MELLSWHYYNYPCNTESCGVWRKGGGDGSIVGSVMVVLLHGWNIWRVFILIEIQKVQSSGPLHLPSLHHTRPLLVIFLLRNQFTFRQRFRRIIIDVQKTSSEPLNSLLFSSLYVRLLLRFHSNSRQLKRWELSEIKFDIPLIKYQKFKNGTSSPLTFDLSGV